MALLWWRVLWLLLIESVRRVWSLRRVMSSSPVGWAQRTQRSISDAIGYLLLYSLSRLTQCAIETTTCPRNNMRKERCMPAYCVAYQSSHSKNHIVSHQHQPSPSWRRAILAPLIDVITYWVWKWDVYRRWWAIMSERNSLRSETMSLPWSDSALCLGFVLLQGSRPDENHFTL